jgi:2-dehydro-3-deoxygluconokinase
VLGVHVSGTDVTSGTLNVDAYRRRRRWVTRKLGPKLVAITLRESLSASDNGWSAVLWDGDTGALHRSQHYARAPRRSHRRRRQLRRRPDLRPGHGPVETWSRLRFAVAASALKQTIPGDFNRARVAEVDALARVIASGRVQR